MATEAALATLDHIWGVLEPLGHPLALMGGISLAAWNHIRATRDVDILIAVDRTAVEPLVEALRASDCHPKKTPPLVSVGDHCFVQFLYTPPGEFYEVQFDLLLAESELQKTALTRTVRREVPGISRPITVLHCDDLFLFKLVAGRLLDRADAAALLRENRDGMDWDYLLGWTARLGLQEDLAEVWREAFPGEAVPTQET
ncbi:nucleotidyl transferase AbiEii/AbiGii toxin family protein [Pirellulales bacterium]|nr:nucleotidyl transferase AbiEii/AbiGii toxin family protein [Pirellulales bacterium]